jgi:hypothetical protein
MTTVLDCRDCRVPTEATTPAAQARTRSGPTPAAGAVVAPEWPGANPAGTGALDGVQPVHPLPLVLALPAARAGGAIRAPVALDGTDGSDALNRAGVGAKTE